MIAALTLLTRESRIAESKIKRIRGYYASQAGVVNASEQLRISNSVTGTVYVGSGIRGYPGSGMPVNITRVAGPVIDGLPTDEISVNATYNP